MSAVACEHPGQRAELVEPWLSALRSRHAELRTGAARLLGLAREPAAVRPLAELIARRDAPAVAAAFDALGAIGLWDAYLEAVLLDALRARFCVGPVVFLLGRIGSAVALSPVFAELGRELGRTQPMLVLEAARALCERAPCRDQRHRAVMSRWLERPELPEAARAAGRELLQRL